jgi:hypothetical protein
MILRFVHDDPMTDLVLLCAEAAPPQGDWNRNFVIVNTSSDR